MAINYTPSTYGLSIIIPTCCNLEGLKNLYSSIKTNTTIIHYEFIIHINTKDKNYHNTVKEIFSSYPEVTIINTYKKIGYKDACNQAIKYCKYDYICILNDDVTVGLRWIDNLINPLKNDDKIVLSGVSLKYVDEKFNQVEYVTNIPYLEGFCLLLKKWYVDKYGLFDENLKYCFCEDVDLCMSIIKNGYYFVAVNSPILHVRSVSVKSTKSEYNKCMRYERQNKKYLIKKWEIS